MKKVELLAAVQGGKLLGVVEYRNSVADVVTYRDKKTGAPASFNKLVHNCEMGNTPVQVNERVPDNAKFDAKSYRAPFKKGQMCVLMLTGLTHENGVAKASGTLESLDE